MGAVLKFPLEQISRTSIKQTNSNQTATILLFEGVRYSRDGEKIHRKKAVKKRIHSKEV